MMSRETFIEKFKAFPKGMNYNQIIETITKEFELREGKFAQLIAPTIVKDKFDVIKYTKICQYIDGFMFKYKTLTIAHIAAICFLLLDINKDMTIKRTDISRYFSKVTDKNSKELKRLEKEADVDGNGVYDIDEFILLYENINGVQLDTNRVKQCVNEWSYKELFSKYCNGKKFIPEKTVIEIIKEEFKIDMSIDTLFKLFETSKVRFYKLDEFTEICNQIQFVSQKVGINIFSINVLEFRILDKQFNGYLTLQQFTKFMQKSGFDVKKDKVKKLIHDLDDNGDGVLQIEEFVNVSNGLCKAEVPASFLFNLNVHNQSKLKIDQDQPQNVRQSICTLVDNKEKPKGEHIVLERQILSNQNYEELFDKLCPLHIMDVSLLKEALKIVIGEQNTHILRKALQIIFNVANINCDGHLTKDEFVILMIATEKNMKDKKVTEEDMYKVFFDCVDGNHDGFIEKNEIKFLVQQINGETMEDPDVDDLLRQYDESGNYKWTLQDYLTYFMDLDEIKLDDTDEVKDKKIKRQIARTFRLIDKDRSNSIEFDEILNYIIHEVGQISQIDKICLTAMFHICDEDHNLSLDMDEFFQFFFLFEYYVDDNGCFDSISIYLELFDMLTKKKDEKIPIKDFNSVMEKIQWPSSVEQYSKKIKFESPDYVNLNEFVYAFTGKNINEED